jgi:hypothetical protein
MAEDRKLHDLIAEMLREHRTTNAQLKDMGSEFGGLREVAGLRGEFAEMRDDFNTRIGRLEEEQKITGVLLRQYTRDLRRVAKMLDERVVHWGDKATIGTGSTRIVGAIQRATEE